MTDICINRAQLFSDPIEVRRRLLIQNFLRPWIKSLTSHDHHLCSTLAVLLATFYINFPESLLNVTNILMTPSWRTQPRCFLFTTDIYLFIWYLNVFVTERRQVSFLLFSFNRKLIFSYDTLQLQFPIPLVLSCPPTSCHLWIHSLSVSHWKIKILGDNN